MPDGLNVEGRISFLNVGTKLLLKDSMDQYLRTLGDFKTHYAQNMTSALRTFSENTIHVIITEFELSDGSAYRLVQELGGITPDDDIYVILALESKSAELLALAAELEVHAVLVKPFAANEIKAQIERYKSWKSAQKEPWQALLHEAHMALKEKKFQDAENFFKQSVVAAPNNPVPYYKAGGYYVKKPDYGLAESLFKKAVTLKPDYTQALSALGNLYLIKGELDKADEFLKKAYAISPLNPDRLNEMMRANLERCAEICRNALRIDPANHAPRVELGKIMALQKNYIGAIRELEPVLPQLKDAVRSEAQTFIALSRKLGGLVK